MTPSRQSLVQKIYLETQGLPAEDQPEAVARLAGEDAEVAAEVLRLLREGSPDMPLGVGDQLKDRYVLEKYLGASAGVSVYLARDLLLAGRPAKVLVTSQGTRLGPAAEGEIRKLADLDHPSIAAVFDMGMTGDGRPFLVTPHIPGPRLRDLMAAGHRFTPSFVAELGRRLAAVLAVAHAARRLHRDLRPESIVLRNHETPEVLPVLTGFGVAAILGAPGQLVPTPVYQAPEVARGAPVPASDLYSLGVILYEALTGRWPDYSGLASDSRLTRPWRRFFVRVLHPDPALRLQSAEEWSSALPAARIAWRLPVATIVLVGCVVALVASSWWRPASPFRQPMEFAPLTTDPGIESHPGLTPDGRSVYFSAAPLNGPLKLHRLDIGEPEPKALTHSAEKETGVVVSPDGRRLAFLRDPGDGLLRLMVMPTAGGPETEIGRGRYNSVDWFPDSRALAVSRAVGTGEPLALWRIGLADRREVRLIGPSPEGRADLHPVFSPDGRRLAFVRKRLSGVDLYVTTLDPAYKPSGTLLLLARDLHGISDPQWTPDGSYLFYLAGSPADRRLFCVPADGSQGARAIPEAGDRLEQLSVARHAETLVLSRSREDSNVWSAALAAPGGPAGPGRAFLESTWDDEEQQISPDGAWVAFVSLRSGSEQVWLAAINGSRSRRVTSIEGGGNLSVHWAPDSARLLVAATVGGRERAWVVSNSGRILRELPPSSNGERACGWSRDGQWFFFAGPAVGLVRQSVEDGRRVTLGGMGGQRPVESWDRRSVYFYRREEGGSVWQMPWEGGKDRLVLTGVQRRGYAVGRSGLYYLANGPDGATRLRYQPSENEKPRDLLTLTRRPFFGLDVSPDERLVLWSQLDADGIDLMWTRTLRVPFSLENPPRAH